MNYIYDILVNFKYPLYDFYDWNKEDNIKNIRKIPFFRVSSDDLGIFKYKRFKVENLLEKIINQTQLFTNKKNKIINYACVFSDIKEAIVFEFDSNGICINKSRMMIEEELEVLDYTTDLEETKINYKILKNDNIDFFKTRKEIELKKYIVKQLEQINDKEKINYLYYECFNKISNKNTKREIISSIDSSWDSINNKIYDFLQLISMNKE